jgi:hypothetical protein
VVIFLIFLYLFLRFERFLLDYRDAEDDRLLAAVVIFLIFLYLFLRFERFLLDYRDAEDGRLLAALVILYQTTKSHIPDDRNSHIHSLENFKTHVLTSHLTLKLQGLLQCR